MSTRTCFCWLAVTITFLGSTPYANGQQSSAPDDEDVPVFVIRRADHPAAVLDLLARGGCVTAVPSETLGEVTRMALFGPTDLLFIEFDTPDEPRYVTGGMITIDGVPQRAYLEPAQPFSSALFQIGDLETTRQEIVSAMMAGDVLEVKLFISERDAALAEEQTSTARFDLSEVAFSPGPIAEGCRDIAGQDTPVAADETMNAPNAEDGYDGLTPPFPIHDNIAGASRLVFRPPSQAEIDAMVEVYGDELILGEDGRTPGLQVATAILNDDGEPDLVAVPRNWCSNVTCNFIFFMTGGYEWEVLGTFEMWGTPYISHEFGPAGIANLIFHQRLDEECTACTSSVPTRVTLNAQGGVSRYEVLDPSAYPFYRSSCTPFVANIESDEFDQLQIDWTPSGPKYHLRGGIDADYGSEVAVEFDGPDLAETMTVTDAAGIQFATDAHKWHELLPLIPDYWYRAAFLRQFSSSNQVTFESSGGVRSTFDLSGSAQAIRELQSCIEVVQ